MTQAFCCSYFISYFQTCWAPGTRAHGPKCKNNKKWKQTIWSYIMKYLYLLYYIPYYCVFRDLLYFRRLRISRKTNTLPIKIIPGGWLAPGGGFTLSEDLLQGVNLLCALIQISEIPFAGADPRFQNSIRRRWPEIPKFHSQSLIPNLEILFAIISNER